MPEQTETVVTEAAVTETAVSPETARYISKWNALFDRINIQCLTFKAVEGITTYPCYGCRDIFAFKDSFLDHINRRGMLIHFVCRYCPRVPRLTFYNPCSMLLHAREHFQAMLGELDLDDVTISLVPIGMAGFFEHPDVPLLFNVEEDNLGEAQEYNSRFYSPTPETKGMRIVQLKPVILLFYTSDVFPPKQLILKQISSNMPSCKFIDVLYNTAVVMNPTASNMTNLVQRKKSKYSKKARLEVETNEPVLHRYSRCPECYVVQTVKMTEHFRGDNRPNNDELKCSKCKYIASSICSLVAHERIHTKTHPFVCPECGKNYDKYKELMQHLDDVCFHMTKAVRYRCMGKNCSKIFASPQSFATHFTTHFETLQKCDDCGYAYKFTDCGIHQEGHSRSKYYICGLCQAVDNNQVLITQEYYLSHLNSHCNDPNQRVYVYNCKSCRSYFRSHETFALHVLRCTKDKEPKVPKAKDTYVFLPIEKRALRCNKCDQMIYELDLRTHHFKCDANQLGEPVESAFDPKQAKQIDIIQPEYVPDPIVFDGTYKCKICGYMNTDKNKFQNHVITHKHLATTYQCMDCGECFLVKSSLAKHLNFMHQIANVDLYFEENNCYNEEAIRAAKEPVTPVGANQCNVCRMKFGNLLELNKHFRIHGMAFLKNNMK